MTQDLVQAYLWLSLAARQDDKDAPRLRASLASRMTLAQVVEAQKLTALWKPN